MSFIMWKKWLIFVFTLCGFITTQLIVNNVSAVSDVSYTSTYNGASFPDIGVICNNADSNPVSCADYNYLIIEKSFDYLTLCNVITQPLLNVNYSGYQIAGFSDYLVFHLDSGVSRIGFFGASSSCSGLTTSDYVKYTLTNTIGTPAEPCPEPEPQEPCEDDTNFIVALFKDGFWGVATAMVYLIVPILALFLVFRLVHDLMWGRK